MAKVFGRTVQCTAGVFRFRIHDSGKSIMIVPDFRKQEAFIKKEREVKENQQYHREIIWETKAETGCSSVCRL